MENLKAPAVFPAPPPVVFPAQPPSPVPSQAMIPLVSSDPLLELDDIYMNMDLDEMMPPLSSGSCCSCGSGYQLGVLFGVRSPC